MQTTHAVPDLMSAMDSFLQLDAAALGQIRKTSEIPARASILDVIGVVTGLANPRNVLKALRDTHPETVQDLDSYSFPGSRGPATIVGDARKVVEIALLLPGKAAAEFRKASASVLVRFLGGDLSLVEELAEIHLSQRDLPDDHPGAFFRDAAESDRVKRAREELQFVETQGRIKRARVESVRDTMVTTWAALEAIGLRPDDRDRARAGDMIRTAAFDLAIADEVDPEICIRSMVSATGIRGPGLDMKVGKLAKKLYMDAYPDYVFPKKSIFANGQQVQANVWKASQKQFVQTAIAQLTDV